MTAGRPALLERALASYITTAMRHGREIEYVVFDDSKDPVARRASLDVALRIARRFKAEVRFAGPEQRALYASQLGEVSNVHTDPLEYGISQSNGYTLGQNRNALLLDSVGALFFCVDDDTVCASSLPPVMDDRIRLCAGADPADFWFFENVEQTRATAKFAEIDPLAFHERLLGKFASELCDESVRGDFRKQTSAGELTRRIIRSRAIVKVTLNGLLGDCAWGAPFGLWQAPMGYLAAEGASLDRLIASEKTYRHACESRQLLRIPPSFALADISACMLTFCGLDNRDLLPPNLPTHRGQDLVFGQTLWRCFSEAICGHVPIALVHEPIPPRRFWRGEITRTAAGIDLCRLMIEAVKLCAFRDDEVTPAQRLGALGHHLKTLADLDHEPLRRTLLDCLHDSNQRFERKLRKKAEEVTDRGRYYADDVARFFDKANKAESTEHYWIPLDLWSTDGPAAAEGRTRQTLKRFGSLLEQWPSIVNGAKILRENGVRISVPV